MSGSGNGRERLGRRIYIAGPMRGKPQFNFRAFDNAAAVLRKAGYDAVSPADLDRAVGFDGHADGVSEAFVHQCIKRDIAALLTCDHVVVLDGWQHSVGARLEVEVAMAAGISVGTLNGEDVVTYRRGGVTMSEVSDVMEAVFAECRHLRACGQAEYAHDQDNAFRNFESIGDRAVVPREVVLMTFFQKHVDGIWSWVHGHRSQRESVRGRINDAIVYLCLLRAMVDQDDHDGRALAQDQPVGEVFMRGVAESMPEVG